MGVAGRCWDLIVEGKMTSIQITLENSFQLSVRLIAQCDYLFEENRSSIKGCYFQFYYKRNKAKETAGIVFKLTWPAA